MVNRRFYARPSATEAAQGASVTSHEWDVTHRKSKHEVRWPSAQSRSSHWWEELGRSTAHIADQDGQLTQSDDHGFSCSPAFVCADRDGLGTGAPRRLPHREEAIGRVARRHAHNLWTDSDPVDAADQDLADRTTAVQGNRKSHVCLQFFKPLDAAKIVSRWG